MAAQGVLVIAGAEQPALLQQRHHLGDEHVQHRRGSYASQNDVFAIYTTVFFGIVGYGLNKIDIHPAPIVLALVLGYLTESNLRRALLGSGSDWTVFFTHPISVVCLDTTARLLLMDGKRTAGSVRHARLDQ